MERTKKKTEEKEELPAKTLFIKNGRGMLKLHSGKVVKGGETFYAYPNEIPSAFRDLIIPVNEGQKQTFKEYGIVEDKTPVYSAREREGSELFDVVDKQGKVVNEEPMNKDEAELLASQLNP